MKVTNARTRRAAAQVAHELAEAARKATPRKPQPRPGTSEWLAQQRADREAREAAELRAYAKGGTSEDAAKAAVRAQRRREARRIVVGARVVTRNGRDAGEVTELTSDGRFWYATVRLDQPYGRQTHATHARSHLVAS